MTKFQVLFAAVAVLVLCVWLFRLLRSRKDRARRNARWRTSATPARRVRLMCEQIEVPGGPPVTNYVPPPVVWNPPLPPAEPLRSIETLLLFAAHESNPATVDRILLKAMLQAEDPKTDTTPRDLFNARYARAVWLMEQGRLTDAQAVLKRFGRWHDPEHVLVLCALASVSVDLGNIEGAEFYINEAADGPTDLRASDVLEVVAVLHKIGDAFRVKLRPEETRHWYQRARQLVCRFDDGSGVVRIIALEKLVDFECRSQRFAEAALVFDQLRDAYAAQTNRCDKPELLERCADMLRRVGRLDEATAIAERAAQARREQDELSIQPSVQQKDRKVLKLKVLPRLRTQQQS